jgi:hypothetical protein
VGRALIVGSAACREEVVRLLRPQGYDCADADDPYAATIELCRNRLAYQMLILCLGSLYREELSLIATAKRRLPHVEIWLAQSDGRMAALAEGMRLGADGLLAEDGSLHRVASAPPVMAELPQTAGSTHSGGTEISGENTARAEQPMSGIDTSAGSAASSSSSGDLGIGEPVLTADELRALLQDQPSMPPSGTSD